MHSGQTPLRLAPSTIDAAPHVSGLVSQPLFSRTPNLRDVDEATMRRCLRDYFVSTFNRYESLFECLANDQAYYTKPITLRHPLI